MQARPGSNTALLAAGIATFVVMGAGQALFGPALNVFARNFGLTLAQAGGLVTVFWLGSAAGVAASFFAPARMTPRLSVAAMAAGALVVALAPGWGVTLAGTSLWGIGYGAAATVLNPRILHAFGERGPAMFSLLNAAFSVGAIFAPLLFVAIGSNPLPAFAAVGAVCVLICLLAREDDAETPVEGPGAGPLRLHPGALGFQMVAIALEATLIGLGPAALIRAGVAETRAAELLSLFFVAFLAARVGLIFALHRLGSFTLHTGALLLAAVAAGAACILPPGPFFVTLGLSAGAFFPSGFVTSMRKMGRDPRVPSVIVAAGLTGAILGPLAVAMAAEHLGPRGFFQLIAGIAAVAAGLAVANLRAMNR